MLSKNQSLEIAVLAAEAKKAGSASEEARRIPKPPSRIGRLARVHCMSEALNW
jgi:hypothetical protein